MGFFGRGRKISSLYAEIGADTTGLKRGLAETKKGLQSADKSFGKLASGGIAAFVGIGGAVLAMKKGIEFAREGAQLEFVRGKFERLAESAGTVSDSLLKDLRAATRGTMSDMQLAAGATDFMSLGLAKTHDQVVRLTRVAGALGMNMNQLVLTLTNRTTMRFDTLNVATDGFDERLKNIKATGMDVNAAFTEAFLQQAEAQIIKVGDVADTNAGKIMQMEASMANLADTAKLGLAPAIGRLAEELNDVLIPVIDNLRFTEELGKALDDNVISYDKAVELLRLYDSSSEGAAEAQQELALQIYGVRKNLGTAVHDLGDFNDAIGETGKIHGPAVTGLDKLAKAHEAAGLAAWHQARVTHELGSEIEEAEPKVKGFLDGIDRNIASPIEAFIKDLEWMASTGGVIEKAFGDIQKGLDAGEITPDQARAWADALYVATQDVQVDLDEISAKDAAINIEETLGVSLDEAAKRITGTEGIAGALDTVTTTQYAIDAAMGESVDDVKDRVGFLADDIDELTAKTYTLKFKIKVSGNLPNEIPGLPPEFQRGGSFTVPAGYSASPYMIGVHSGEYVEVTPAGKGKNAFAPGMPILPSPATVGGASTPAIKGGDTYNEMIVDQHFYDRGAAALGQAEIRRIWKSRLNESMGV